MSKNTLIFNAMLTLLLCAPIAGAQNPAKQITVLDSEGNGTGDSELIPLTDGFVARTGLMFTFFDRDLNEVAKVSAAKAFGNYAFFESVWLAKGNDLYCLAVGDPLSENLVATVYMVNRNGAQKLQSFNSDDKYSGFYTYGFFLSDHAIHMLARDHKPLKRMAETKFNLFSFDWTNGKVGKQAFQVPYLEGENPKEEPKMYYTSWLVPGVAYGKMVLARMTQEKDNVRFMSVEVDAQGQLGKTRTYKPGKTFAEQTEYIAPVAQMDSLHGHIYFMGYMKNHDGGVFDGIYVHQFRYADGSFVKSIYLDLKDEERKLKAEVGSSCQGIPGNTAMNMPYVCNPYYFHYDPLNDVFTVQFLGGVQLYQTGTKGTPKDNRKMREYTFDSQGKILFIAKTRNDYSGMLLQTRHLGRAPHPLEYELIYTAPGAQPVQYPYPARSTFGASEAGDYSGLLFWNDRAVLLRNINAEGKVKAYLFKKAQ